MALVKFTQTTSSKLGTIAKKTGTVYFLTDTNQIYGDFEVNGTVTRAKYTADGFVIGSGVQQGDRVQVYWRRYRPSDQSEENSFVHACTVQGSGDSVQTLETAIAVEPEDRFSMWIANNTANRGTLPRGACKLNMQYTYISE